MKNRGHDRILLNFFLTNQHNDNITLFSNEIETKTR
jgi:hypothetical protein